MPGISFHFTREIERPPICMADINVECLYWPSDNGAPADVEIIGWTVDAEVMNSLPSDLWGEIQRWVNGEYVPLWLDGAMEEARKQGLPSHDRLPANEFTLQGCGGYR